MTGTKRILSVAVAAALIVMVLACGTVFGAASVTLNNDSKVTAGQTFTVKVIYSENHIGRVSGQLSYDPEIIEYLSGGSSSGNGGVIQLKGYGDGSRNITFHLKFKAISSGTSKLEVSTNEMYNLDEEPLNTPSTSSSIQIVSGQGEDQDGGTAQDGDSGQGEAEDEAQEQESEQDQEQDEDTESDADSEEDDTSSTIYFVIAGVLILLILIIALILYKQKHKKA